MASAYRLPEGYTIRDSRNSPELFQEPAARETIYEFLKSPEVYWGHGRSQTVIDRQIAGAYINFGVFWASAGPAVEGQEGVHVETPCDVRRD